ncbi:tripartite tricarboxylate transporter TctB family protein [Aureimonas ureilytica]|uniref:tripartite tricarboxylate transporter TctB family protein n=1 Tax=Aureimonas ureilytica TaxID=401562 RepID=UPI000A65F265|nr:tripartite tricarboxylate transporter TctB family protein [Aureimonas ureilytica]
MIDRMKTRSFASGLVFAALGAVGLAMSFEYTMGSARQMGPGYFPALVFGVLLLLGAGIAGKALGFTSSEPLESFVCRPLVVIVGALTVFALAVERLGFVLACAGLVLIATMAGTRLSILQRLMLAAVITTFCWLVFILGLGLLIPTWPEFAA